jgi:hypothetical protein
MGCRLLSTGGELGESLVALSIDNYRMMFLSFFP